MGVSYEIESIYKAVECLEYGFLTVGKARKPSPEG